jgi:aminoglycoside 3-N-acetyltransferase
VLRSSHPAVSFAAWGYRAEHITSGHALDYSLGERSPLARIYDLDGSVLLLGVGYDCNTSFHLAEYRIPGATPIVCGAPVIDVGERVWKVYPDIALDADVFAELGTAFERLGHVRWGRIGSAEARLFSQRRAVAFAVDWLAARRAGKAR